MGRINYYVSADSVRGILLTLPCFFRTALEGEEIRSEREHSASSVTRRGLLSLWPAPSVRQWPRCPWEQLHPCKEWMMTIWFSCTHKKIKFVKTHIYEIEKLGDTCRNFEGIWTFVCCQQVQIIYSVLYGDCLIQSSEQLYEVDCYASERNIRHLPSRVSPDLALLRTTLQPTPNFLAHWKADYTQPWKWGIPLR